MDVVSHQGLIGNLTAAASPIVNVAKSTMVNSSAIATSIGDGSSSFSLGHVVLVILKVIPSILFWLVTFLSITLPTWLFTLFSTSLTFTMNFTTL